MGASVERAASVMRPAEESGIPGVPAVPAVMGGVVSRRALFGRLDDAERVVRISAPAGSGKTVLVRSWIAEAGLAQRTAWVHVNRQERDPRRFWTAVAGALRGVAAGAAAGTGDPAGPAAGAAPAAAGRRAYRDPRG
jgi:LuxR family transcriptional regulator, maltose regulon positive regulatory protein